MKLHALLPLPLLFALGCGGAWGTVDGAVTLDDQPLDKGNVTFLPVTEGATAYGSIGSGGRFTVATGDRPGLKTGDYIVTVVSQTIPKDGSGEAGKFLTPSKYAMREKSDLRATIGPGVNPITLRLVSK